MCSARDVSIQSLQCSSGQQRTDAQSPSGDINTSFPSMLLCAMRAQPTAFQANNARMRRAPLATSTPLFPPCFCVLCVPNQTLFGPTLHACAEPFWHRQTRSFLHALSSIHAQPTAFQANNARLRRDPLVRSTLATSTPLNPPCPCVLCVPNQMLFRPAPHDCAEPLW
jgi:hypothetical protein